MRDKFRIVQKDINNLPDGLYNIEECLYLRIRGDKKNFLCRVTIDGVRREKSLGSARLISLAVAKQKWASLKTRMFNGEDIFSKDDEELAPRFEDVAREAIENTSKTRHWGATQHRIWTNSIANHVLPKFCKKRIDQVTRNDVAKVLEPLWYKNNPMASKLRGRIERIFDFATFKGYFNKPNPARWRGNLDMILASPSSLAQDKHHFALTADGLAEACKRVRNSPHMVYKALLFTALTASRISESVKAKWSEVDFESAIWSVPPERRKDGKSYPHRVPLSSQAIELLKGIDRTSSPFIFQSRMTNSNLAPDSVRKYLKKISGDPNATSHGMRSTFRDWCADSEKDRVLAEKSLMHSVGNSVEQAYQRSDLLDLRRPLMQEWADFLLGNSNGN